LCIASASLLTEHVRGLRLSDLGTISDSTISTWLEGDPPAARRKCALLPLDTLNRAVASRAAG